MMLRSALVIAIAISSFTSRAQPVNCPNLQEVAKSADFPSEALAAGLTTGKAVVEFVVRADGTVGDLLVESQTHPAFGQAALAMAARLQCDPRQSEIRTRLPINFDMPKPKCQRGTFTLGEVSYPDAAARLGLEEGSVVLEFNVWSDGRITDITTVEASHESFNAAAREAVIKAKAIGCPQSDRPVRMRVPFKFKLE